MQFLDLIVSYGHAAPLPNDMEQAQLAFAALSDTSARATLEAVLADPRGKALLEGAFDGSPYLGRLAASAPNVFQHLFEAGPDIAFARVIDGLEDVGDRAAQDAAMGALRQAKRGAALIIGLSDLAGVWPLERVTAALSELARAAVDAALIWLLADAGRRNVLIASDEPPAALLQNSGIIILGMGKLGAEELNYSSDIDLIILFDPEKIPARRPDRIQQEMVRLSRGLVQMLEELTRDGYVFRTDLRLRPDPASTPLALSILAAEVYYESAGQNWERAAMIKARPIAGDIEAGQAFMARLRPFVWRRSLDFNAIKDIQSIKRQIDRKQGGEPPSAYSHNVKLGRGGIREIEFFAQTQQLIWGGRDASLRGNQTLRALSALVEAGHVEGRVAQDLTAAYCKLRTIEHRLQMVDDRQTHDTPAEGQAHAFARFAGYADRAEFADDLMATLGTVETHYAALFFEEEGLGGGRALSFTGVDDHPDTLATIQEMGFEAPAQVAAIIRGWHHGRVRAMRTARAREILTELTPDLLARFGAAHRPDKAFAAFANFLEGLPAGVQIFSLFMANRGLLDFLARILSRSDYLARHINQHPHVLDAVLTDEFMRPPGDRQALEADLALEMGDAADFQDVLDGARRWISELRLRLGVQTLEARLTPIAAAQILADAADVAAERMLAGATAEFETAHGKMPGGAYGIVAYGKWGSRELTIGSDLDLVALYDAPEDALSDGQRPLPPAVYYIRLTQRLLTALTTLTGEGRLFEVDVRLRPSGDDGPIATHISALTRYLDKDAWTWELMALSRARYAFGDTSLGDGFMALRARLMAQSRLRAGHLKRVMAMRSRIAEAKGAGGPWSVKLRRGGMVDVEFIAQGLALLHGEAQGILGARSPADQLSALAAVSAETAIISDAAMANLAEAARFWLSAQWGLRLLGYDDDADTLEPTGGDKGDFTADDARAIFASAVGYGNYTELRTARESAAAAVSHAYDAVFGAIGRDMEQEDER